MKTETIPITVVLSIVLTAFINHLLANTRDKRKLRREQGQKLNEAFRPELDALAQTNGDARMILTEEAYRRHESEIRLYMPYLSWLHRFQLRLAWERLGFHPKLKAIPFYEQYADCGSLEKRRVVRPTVIKRIEKIMALGRK